MIKENLFSIPVWTLSVNNFNEKKKKLKLLLKDFPEKKTTISNF